MVFVVVLLFLLDRVQNKFYVRTRLVFLEYYEGIFGMLEIKSWNLGISWIICGEICGFSNGPSVVISL